MNIWRLVSLYLVSMTTGILSTTRLQRCPIVTVETTTRHDKGTSPTTGDARPVYTTVAPLHPARSHKTVSGHAYVWPSLHCVVVRGSVKPTCEESSLQRNLQERVWSVLFAFSRAGLFMWSAKCVQEKNSAFSVVT